MRLFYRALAVLLVLPAVVQAEQPVGVPDVHVGDRWTFQQKDGLTDDIQAEFTRRVVTVSSTEITAVQQTKGRPGQAILYFLRDWNLEDNGVVKNDSSTLVLRLPMKVGDSWQGHYKSRNLSNGFTSVCDVVAKVTARETVQVPAGSFEALKVDGRNTCQSAAGTGPSVVIASSNWYAPAAKAIVKGISSQVYEGRERGRTISELLSFSLADHAEPSPPPAPSGPGAAAPAETRRPAGEKGI